MFQIYCYNCTEIIVKVVCQEVFIPARKSSETLGRMNNLADIFKRKFVTGSESSHFGFLVEFYSLRLNLSTFVVCAILDALSNTLCYPDNFIRLQ